MDKHKSRFDTESMFKKYLELVKLDESKLSVTQYTELKRAFYGGLGVLYKTLTQDVSALSEMEAMNVLTYMEIQISKFWSEQTENFISKLN